MESEVLNRAEGGRHAPDGATGRFVGIPSHAGRLFGQMGRCDAGSVLRPAIGAACFYVSIPYAPISPAYSLVSQDHGKLKDIAALLDPDAIFADDGAAFASALRAIASDGRHVIMPTICTTAPTLSTICPKET